VNTDAGDTRLEALLRRDRLLVAAGLTLAVVLSWSWLVPMARDMYGDMRGAAAWMMASEWDLPYAAAMFGMWATMMLGMMLPSAAPTILVYARVARTAAPPGPAVAQTYAFAAGYLLVWTAFSAASTTLQWALSRAGLMSPMLQTTAPALGASILLAAGVYQLTPVKRTCLARCRSPFASIAENWRDGVSGALRMGLRHGADCLGCCWALMLLLFFGGVMSLAWIALLTLAVLAEKLLPFGENARRIGGVLLIAAGAVVLLRAPAG
jgi:predicted metal-binding membrane protein